MNSANVLVCVVGQRDPVREAQVNTDDIRSNAVDLAPGVEMIGPTATAKIDPGPCRTT
jgi:hypothetical protein